MCDKSKTRGKRRQLYGEPDISHPSMVRQVGWGHGVARIGRKWKSNNPKIRIKQKEIGA